MKEQAVKKLRDEMASKPSDGYVQAVGGYMITQVENSNETVAQLVLANGKSLAGSLEAMRSVAEKKKNGNVAVLTDAEGFKAVMDYYRIPGPALIVASSEASQPFSTPPADVFTLSLDDLL